MLVLCISFTFAFFIVRMLQVMEERSKTIKMFLILKNVGFVYESLGKFRLLSKVQDSLVNGFFSQLDLRIFLWQNRL